ncbi:hypothetical protein [Actinoplanes lobatus]|uniref:Uncharacterized protein YbbK (DUF523 family) n=1 Tax=Actinoplanes lobatus TaxID=113568 RepID=A0A7W7HKR2_9ACTN|nr:hypothetical protein [Actinoplanes lobatus]MBB4752348.1 uncharacterized protein YbbK (DUF523 family) [Actinoplanes lobatus]
MPAPAVTVALRCSSHRGQAAIDRLTARFPNAVMVHTPIHASWTNQIEISWCAAARVPGLPTPRPRIRLLRQRGSSQSKPVGSAHAATGVEG